jgi:hypothetical protein
VLEHGDLELDASTRRVRRAGRELALRPKELGVLELLLAAQGRVVSAEELLFRVWDEETDPYTTTVKVTISRLRQKLGDPPLIEPSRKPVTGSEAAMRVHLPRRTVRLGLTIVYAGLFLVSGRSCSRSPTCWSSMRPAACCSARARTAPPS